MKEFDEDSPLFFHDFLKLCHLEMNIFDVDESQVSEEAKKNINYEFEIKNGGCKGSNRWFGLSVKNTKTNNSKTIYLYGNNHYAGWSLCDSLIVFASWCIENKYMATSYPYLEEIYDTLKEVMAENFTSFLHYLIVDKSCPVGTKYAIASIPETGPETIRLMLADKDDCVSKKAIQHPNAAQWATFL
jgi:hypothetical protein